MKTKKIFYLILIILGIVLSTLCYYMYKKMTNNKNEEIKFNSYYENNENIVLLLKPELDNNSVNLLNDKYYYENKNNELYYIKDLKNNILYKNNGGDKFTSLPFIGNDNNIYITKYKSCFGNAENCNDDEYLELYKLENKTFKLIFKEELKDSEYFNTIYTSKITNDNYYDYIVGFIIFNQNNKQKYFINLDGSKSDYILSHDNGTVAIDNDFYINNSNYYPIIKEKKKGLLDVKNNKIKIDYLYDDIITTSKNLFIAINDGKSGVIDENNNVLVPLEYDFVDIANNYLIVGKDHKLALMDFNYKFITEFDFDYSLHFYRSCCGNHDTFSASKIGNNYVLYTYQEGENRNPIDNKFYLINSNGKYESIEGVSNYFIENDRLILEFDNTIKVYNQNFKYLYSIDKKTPDYMLVGVIDNTLIYCYRDSNDKDYLYDYYNIETGKELTNTILSINNIVIKNRSSKVSIYDNHKYITNFELSNSHSYKKIENGIELIGKYDKKYMFILNK